ncbi:AAA family ATPase [Roseibacillus ishigakijimensis]|uniref:AAA family ATPase n=1 Tax=Roseibacillus ishigakijimensis TaxID=454146 RepID=A0A934RQZ1_9BACT|nr:AAA family ATPase [Roseibacillus ishigakijimensis]MBK1834282.1 AAA family ATPase [Roseibacillus ishigakijimensis]
MLHSLSIQGYRSLLDVSLKLAPLTVVQGANGAGKSNLYKALRLFSALAEGTFPQAMAAEGGTPSCFWAAPTPGPQGPKTISLNARTAAFDWQVKFGLVPTTPGDPTFFRTDPDVKKETLRSETATHSRAAWSREISHTESLLSYIRDSANYPELAQAREDILSWRFYEGFRSDDHSPLRQPSARYWSPVLHPDGSNLAAALQTIRESSFPYRLEEIIARAFPEHKLEIDGENASQLGIRWSHPDLKRPLAAHELSDGTLRFLALTAALLAPQPPSLLVLNEPENSLNPSLFPALEQLIEWANEASQVLVITHSEALATHLQEQKNALHHQLVLKDGATRLAQDAEARRVWNFD